MYMKKLINELHRFASRHGDYIPYPMNISEGSQGNITIDIVGMRHLSIEVVLGEDDIAESMQKDFDYVIREKIIEEIEKETKKGFTSASVSSSKVFSTSIASIHEKIRYDMEDLLLISDRLEDLQNEFR